MSLSLPDDKREEVRAKGQLNTAKQPFSLLMFRIHQVHIAFVPFDALADEEWQRGVADRFRRSRGDGHAVEYEDGHAEELNEESFRGLF